MSVGEMFKKVAGSFKKRFQNYFHFLQERKSAKWYFGVLLLFPAIGMLALVVILPLYKNQSVEVSPAAVTKDFIAADDSVDNVEVLKKFSEIMLKLKMEELFLNSQLAMSKSDSIGLSLNIVDSTLSLYIKGVNIRECQIHHFKMTHAFKRLKADPMLLDWLAQPFVLQKAWATVPQVPIKIRKAPKDTIEAQKNKSEPVTLDKPDVYFTLQFDRNLTIKVYQIESNSFWGFVRKWYYYLRSFLRMLVDTFWSFYHLKIPQSPMWIELKISKTDALAIYRALPSDAAMTLKL